MTERAPEGPHERTVARWYSVTRDGLACLCLDEANAREMVAQCDRDYPKHAPHKAMRLVDADELDRLRALLRRQWQADAVLYALPHECSQEEHEAALREHDEAHAEIGALLTPNAAVTGRCTGENG